MNIYQEQILDHYKNPQNFGKPEWKPTHVGKLINYSCGDEVTVFLQIEDGKIVKYAFEGSGCSISIASASLLSDQILNKSLEDVRELEYEDIQKILGIDLTMTRQKCAILSLEAVKDAKSN